MELINALKSCLAKSQASKPSDTSVTSSPRMEVLVGEECAAIKQEMQFKEQVLLREISFDLQVNSSQKYLLNFARSTQMHASIVKIAAFLCNDSLVYTDLCIRYETAEIAAGCLAAASLIGRAVQLSDKAFDFTLAFDISRSKMDAVGFVLLQMLEATKSSVSA